MKTLKIGAIIIVTLIIAINLQQAIAYYNIGRISLPDQFYWQSINDVVVDNKGDKTQTVTIGYTVELAVRPLPKDSIGKLLLVTKRDSYHTVW